MLIFVSILLSLERRKKFNLGSLGGREEGESLSLGGRKKKNVLTISRLIYRRASRCVSTREERERRVVFRTFLSFSLRPRVCIHLGVFI